MPNWISNTVYVTGDPDAARALRAFMTTPTSKFDFQALLPMPDELKASQSSSDARMVWQLKYGEWTEIQGRYGPTQFASRDDAIAAARAAGIKPQSFDELADRVQSLVVKYGFPDWYEWACATWGTNWPASEAGWMGPARAAKRDAHQVAYFETAWSPPVPVIVELSARFPDVIVRLDYHDTDCYGGICGFVSVQGGIVIAEKHSHWDAMADSVSIGHQLDEADEHWPPVYVGHKRDADERGPAFARSPWANPFVFCDCPPEEAVKRYRRWLQGDAEVIKQLPPGHWPLPDVASIRDTFIGKTILCDCTAKKGYERPGCHAEVLADLFFCRDGEPESLDDDECDAPVTRGCDGWIADATGLIPNAQDEG